MTNRKLQTTMRGMHALRGCSAIAGCRPGYNRIDQHGWLLHASNHCLAPLPPLPSPPPPWRVTDQCYLHSPRTSTTHPFPAPRPDAAGPSWQSSPLRSSHATGTFLLLACIASVYKLDSQSKNHLSFLALFLDMAHQASCVDTSPQKSRLWSLESDNATYCS